MDFGLDKLVEMIEERFGRTAGTVVLAALGVAAFAFAVHALFAYLILPAVRNAPDFLTQFGIAANRLTPADVIIAGLELAIAAFCGVVFAAVSRIFLRRYQRRTQLVMKDVLDITERCRDYTDKNHRELEAHLEHVRSEGTKFLETAMADASKIIEEANQEAQRIRAEALLPQSPQDIGGNRQP